MSEPAPAAAVVESIQPAAEPKLFDANAPRLSRRMKRRGSLPTSVWQDPSVWNVSLHQMAATPWQQVSPALVDPRTDRA